ncbi:MBL fold metallo-hydrolase [Cryomorpha ignava]|uniref:MBL fold metallo-hydrolase n=1 Tax=Cryomorpha ignava TaxID=101383 RepID=A0A7K3WXT6_9FLAO|nr:MBL fold metallo-hydrolase [Cryomorpha ignava]
MSTSERIYWSGDSGYGAHFKEIGEKLGPFDWAFVECGQFNKLWHAIHMFPEESVQAVIDARASRAGPIHWGAFTTCAS